MIFRAFSDGMGGFTGYWTTPGMDAATDLLAGPVILIALLAGPIFCVVALGEQLLFPAALVLLAIALAYTPAVNGRKQNTLFEYTKLSLAMPIAYYAVTCVSWAIGVGGANIAGTSGILTLMAMLVGVAVVLMVVVETQAVATPLLLLWVGAYFAGVNGGFPTATNYILHIAYLESIVVFIVGVVKTVKNKDTNGIYILPKLIAFVLGCAPLAVVALVKGLPEWMLAGIMIVSYLAIYLVYNFVLKQPSTFADWLMTPFFLSMLCYIFATAYPEYIFPSELVEKIYDILMPMRDVFAPGFEVCAAFAGIISDILYGIMKLLIDILPDVGFHARHFNIPSIIGAVVGIILIASVCNFTGKQMAKRTRAKA